MYKQTRRTFLSKVPAAAALAFSPVNAEAGQSRSKIPNNINDILLDAVWYAESSRGPNSRPRYEAHLNKISNTSLEDTSQGDYQGIPLFLLELKTKHPNLPDLYDTKNRPNHFLLYKTIMDALKNKKNIAAEGFSTIEKEIIKSIMNDNIARKYAKKELEEHFLRYEDALLAAAAYNSGPWTPRNARIQEQLNDLIEIGYIPRELLGLENDKLFTDGALGHISKRVIKSFQKQYNKGKQKEKLSEDGIVPDSFSSETWWALQEAWKSNFPNKNNPLGAIPLNDYTPRYVARIKSYILNH
jgi:hypothetical protein